MATASTANAFLAWFAEWGNVVFAAAQIAFWIVVGASALIAALQYRRFVSHKVRAHGKVSAADTATNTTAEPAA